MTEKPPERPLHVRVAEALGWTDAHLSGWIFDRGEGIQEDRREWCGFSPWQAQKEHRGQSQKIPRYDTSWEATGPLVEKYKITLGYELGFSEGEQWLAEENDGNCYGIDPSPLLAVCILLLKMAEAGKLTEEK